MSCRLEPMIWSCDTGQQIPCLDRCQLIITWMSNIKEVHGKPTLHVSINLLFWNMTAMLRDSTIVAVVAVMHTRPQAIPLPLITMRKSIHGFLFPYNYGYGALLGSHWSSAINSNVLFLQKAERCPWCCAFNR